MTDQLTDEYLEKRADKLTRDKYGDPVTCSDNAHISELTKAISTNCNASGYWHATHDALKVHRESLRCLEGCPHYGSCRAADNHIHSTNNPCTCGLDQHIASLRELLGVSQ